MELMSINKGERTEEGSVSSPAKIYYLEGLRGIAAFVVVLHHLSSQFGVVLTPSLYRVYLILTSGKFAVCTFFILSGYVLTLPVKNKTSNISNLGEYALRRYFRLTPVAFVSVVLCFLLWNLVGETVNAMGQWGTNFKWVLQDRPPFPLYWSDAIYNGLIGIYQGNNSINGVLWTIRVEFLGSLLLFASLSFFWRSKNYILLMLLLSSVFIFFFRDTGIYLALFFVGSILCRCKQRKMSLLLLLPALYFGGDAFLLIHLLHMGSDVPFRAAAAVLLLATLLGNARAQALLSHKSLKWLGSISYSLYALHMLVLCTLGNFVFLQIAPINYWLAGLLAILTTIVAGFLLSHLCHKFVDVPSQKMAKRIAKLIVGDKAPIGS